MLVRRFGECGMTIDGRMQWSERGLVSVVWGRRTGARRACNAPCLCGLIRQASAPERASNLRLWGLERAAGWEGMEASERAAAASSASLRAEQVGEQQEASRSRWHAPRVPEVAKWRVAWLPSSEDGEPGYPVGAGNLSELEAAGLWVYALQAHCGLGCFNFG